MTLKLNHQLVLYIDYTLIWATLRQCVPSTAAAATRRAYTPWWRVEPLTHKQMALDYQHWYGSRFTISFKL